MWRSLGVCCLPSRRGGVSLLLAAGWGTPAHLLHLPSRWTVCGQGVWLSLQEVKTVVCAVLWHYFFFAHCSSILCKWVTKISWCPPTTSAENGLFSSAFLFSFFFFFIPPSLLPHNLVKQGCTFLPWHNAAWLRNTEPICLCDNMENSIELQK